jgi:hypothetical protein
MLTLDGSVVDASDSDTGGGLDAGAPEDASGDDLGVGADGGQAEEVEVDLTANFRRRCDAVCSALGSTCVEACFDANAGGRVVHASMMSSETELLACTGMAAEVRLVGSEQLSLVAFACCCSAQ